MEFQLASLNRTDEKGKAFSQVTIDEDYVIKDNKPDVLKIIYATGNVIFDETKISGQSVWVSGRLRFVVLYRSEDEHVRIASFWGEVPIREKLVMDGIDETDPVKVSGELEDLTVGIINSRKINLRAVLNLTASVETQKEISLTTDMKQMSCEKKMRHEECLNLLASGHDIMRIHTELTLPQSKTNISKLLWYDAQLRNDSIRQEQSGMLVLSGEVYFYALYVSDEEQYEWLEHTISVHQELEKAEPLGDVLWTKLNLEAMEAEAIEDADGELRIMNIDLSYGLDYKIWKKTDVDILEDVYALNRELRPKREVCQIPVFQMKNTSQIRVMDNVNLDSNQQRILQICSTIGKIMIDHVSVEEDGLLFEGVLQVDIVYLTSDDNFPIAHTRTALSFEQLVEVNEMQPDTQYDYYTSIDSLQVNLLDHETYEVKAMICIAVLAMGEQMTQVIRTIEEKPLDMDMLHAQPGIIGYITKDGDDIWEIAKKYHTTIEEIVTTNELKDRSIKKGQKLLIVKHVK